MPTAHTYIGDEVDCALQPGSDINADASRGDLRHYVGDRASGSRLGGFRRAAGPGTDLGCNRAPASAVRWGRLGCASLSARRNRPYGGLVLGLPDRFPALRPERAGINMSSWRRRS